MTLVDAGVLKKKESLWLIVKRFCGVAPFVLAIFFCLYFKSQINISAEQFAIFLTYSTLSLILAGTYFYTYKYFADNFYFFIAIFWLSSAVYIMLDAGRPAYLDSGFYTYSWGLLLLNFSSDLFLLLALLSVGVRKLARMKWMIVGASLVGVGSLILSFLFVSQSSEDNNIINLIPESVLSFLLLCTVGAILSERLKKENVKWSRKAILFTFYAYAFLQLLYPYVFYRQKLRQVSILSIYLITQLTKVGNAIAMQGALQSVIATRNTRAKYEMDVSEAELAVVKEKLQSKNQLEELGALAASIKHDINTPLATMGFEISALKEKYTHDLRIIRRLERLEESMERIYSIVKIVDVIRGDRAFYDRDRLMNKVSMMEIVHRAIRAIKNERKDLKQQNAKSSIKVEGRDVYVRGYIPMLEQVVVNIIKNGLEAIEEAGRERGVIRIKVGIAELPLQKYWHWAKVEIEDNGVGIPEENFNELTTLFTTKGDRKPNSGIGLFISRKIVDIHEGSISFESKLGEETIVTLLLPEWSARQKAEQQAYESSQKGDILTGEGDS